MKSKRIVRVISAFVAAGVLSGVAAATAEAATPTTSHTTIAATRTGVTPTPMYSQGFTMQNKLGATTMKLVAANGDNEGLPQIGSEMLDDDTQRFEVQYVAAGKGVVDATYDIYDTYRGTLLGTVVIEMTYDWDRCTNMRIKDRRGSIVGWNLMLLFPYTSTDAWIEVGPTGSK